MIDDVTTRRDSPKVGWGSRSLVAVLVAVLILSYPGATSAQAETIYETVPIDIRPGAVHIEWTVLRSDPSAGCTASAWLRPEGAERPPVAVYAVRLSGPGEGVETGQAPLDGIGPGRYLLDLGGSDCWWSINVVER